MLKRCGQKAQTMMEYMALLTVVIVVLITMSTYIRRGFQGFIRLTADQLGNQLNAEQTFDDKGHLENSYAITLSSIDKERKEQLGVVNYLHNDVVRTDSFSFLNAGFQYRPNQ